VGQVFGGESQSLTASNALELKVIDLLAKDLPDCSANSTAAMSMERASKPQKPT